MENTKCTHPKTYVAVRHIGGIAIIRCCTCIAVVK